MHLCVCCFTTAGCCHYYLNRILYKYSLNSAFFERECESTKHNNMISHRWRALFLSAVFSFIRLTLFNRFTPIASWYSTSNFCTECSRKQKSCGETANSYIITNYLAINVSLAEQVTKIHMNES